MRRTGRAATRRCRIGARALEAPDGGTRYPASGRCSDWEESSPRVLPASRVECRSHCECARGTRAAQLLGLLQRGIELGPRNRREAEPREEMAGGGRQQVDVAYASFPCQLERGFRQLFAQTFAASFGLDRHGPQQSGLTVDFYSRAPDYLLVVARDERCLDVLVDASDRQRACTEQRQDVRDVSPSRRLAVQYFGA